jgi:hypothetical protein
VDTWLHLPEIALSFDRDQTNSLRFDPRSVIATDTARATELAASILMERFGILESMLPSLLFVSSQHLDQPELIRLDPNEPMRSLYSDVLSPLSDEFRRLKPYWKRWCQLQRQKRDRQEALETIEKSRTEEAVLRDKLEVANKLFSESGEIHSKIHALENKKAELERQCQQYANAKNLDERVKLVLRSDAAYPEVGRLVSRLADLESERQTALLAATTEGAKERINKISSSINRARNKLGNAAAQPSLRAKSELTHTNTLIYTIATPLRERDEVKYSLRLLHEKLGHARQTVSSVSDESLRIEEQEVAELYAEMKSRGFGDEVLKSYHPSAMDVVAALAKSRRLGVQNIKQTRDMPFRILFLAANPVNTTPLDLEEEMRAVEKEIRGTRCRDKITFSGHHAVRPDDLIRYVREEKPDVLHFIGHGTSDGIALRDDGGGLHIVQGEALARFFTGRGVKMVILNCCYSEEQAKAIAAAVDTVIGTRAALGDKAARRFSVAFYRTLGDGYPIAEAFRDGGDTLPLHNLPDVYHLLGKSDWAII